jgi:hypothetical protein
MPAAARAWLAQPELTRLWDKVHERLQRNGIVIRGYVLIPDTSHDEREALSLLMGRAYSASRVSVALPGSTWLEAALRRARPRRCSERTEWRAGEQASCPQCPAG